MGEKTSARGVVRCRAGRLLSVSVDTSLLSPQKATVVEDLTTAAVNAALEKSNAVQSARMAELAEEIGRDLASPSALGGFGGFGGLMRGGKP